MTARKKKKEQINKIAMNVWGIKENGDGTKESTNEQTGVGAL